MLKLPEVLAHVSNSIIGAKNRKKKIINYEISCRLHTWSRAISIWMGPLLTTTEPMEVDFTFDKDDSPPLSRFVSKDSGYIVDAEEFILALL